MTKFFEKLIDKFFDFFNFGRFITIIIPGLLVALCCAMLASQLLFPVSRSEKQIAPAAALSQKIESPGDKGLTPAAPTGQKASPAKAKKKTDSSVKGKSQPAEAASTKAAEGPSSAAAAQTVKTPTEWFSAQAKQDFQKVKNNFYYVLIFAVILGLMLYEVGFRVILRLSSKTKTNLFRYSNNDTYNAEGKIVKHDFDFSTTTVGLAYYAPFLKEKFSGDANYFDFLVTEYYRFLEFSVLMPSAIILSALTGFAYFLLFGIRNACWPHAVGILCVLIGVCILNILFLYIIPPKVSVAYKKAAHDLVQGVTDFMSKQLGKS